MYNDDVTVSHIIDEASCHRPSHLIIKPALTVNSSWSQTTDLQCHKGWHLPVTCHYVFVIFVIAIWHADMDEGVGCESSDEKKSRSLRQSQNTES